MPENCKPAACHLKTYGVSECRGSERESARALGHKTGSKPVEVVQVTLGQLEAARQHIVLEKAHKRVDGCVRYEALQKHRHNCHLRAQRLAALWARAADQAVPRAPETSESRECVEPLAQYSLLDSAHKRLDKFVCRQVGHV